MNGLRRLVRIFGQVDIERLGERLEGVWCHGSDRGAPARGEFRLPLQ
jgi:hypothetical protein